MAERFPPRYPRIPHLFPTPAATRDDLVLTPEDARPFLTETVLVEEKLDGANVALWLDAGGALQVASRAGPGGRDRGGQLGRLRAWAAERAVDLRKLLAEGAVLYGEWLYRTHSVPYGRLPDLLVGIDLWSPEAGFLPPHGRDERLRAAGLTVPPRAYGGVLGDERRALALLGRSAFGSGPAEGVILRRDAADRPLGIAKLLAPSFERASDDQLAAPGAFNRVAR